MDKNTLSTWDLVDIVKTKRQASDFTNNLLNLKEKLFKTSQTMDQRLSECLSETQKEKVLSLSEKLGIDINDSKTVESLILLIIKTIREFPTITLCLAFEPSNEFVNSIGEWFISNTNICVLVEITVDYSIIAGAIIVSEGNYIDLSIKKKIDELLQNNQLQIPAISQ